MARNPIVFSNGTLVSNAKVNVGGTIYDVEPAQYEGTTPLSASNMNQLQTNLYDYVEEYADDKVINEDSESTTESYSADYVNKLIDGTWQNVTLSANWASLGSTFNTLQCRKVGNKIELRGGIDKSTTKVALETFATLPVGYRPTKRVIAGCLCGPTQIQRIDIYPSGEINLAASINSTCQFLVFDGLCFYID